MSVLLVTAEAVGGVVAALAIVVSQREPGDVHAWWRSQTWLHHLVMPDPRSVRRGRTDQAGTPDAAAPSAGPAGDRGSAGGAAEPGPGAPGPEATADDAGLGIMPWVRRRRAAPGSGPGCGAPADAGLADAGLAKGAVANRGLGNLPAGISMHLIPDSDPLPVRPRRQ